MGTEQADAPEQPPIDIKVLTGPPGCRKTTRMREDALRVPGLYLFSMPTKALIEEQAAEFRTAQPSLPVFSVHTDIKPKRKINRQIEEALAAVRDGGHQHAVVMLTHVSMMAEDLTGFHGWHARIDEAPNSVQSGKASSRWRISVMPNGAFSSRLGLVPATSRRRTTPRSPLSKN